MNTVVVGLLVCAGALGCVWMAVDKLLHIISDRIDAIVAVQNKKLAEFQKAVKNVDELKTQVAGLSSEVNDYTNEMHDIEQSVKKLHEDAGREFYRASETTQKIFGLMKECMTGIDQNTRDMFAKFKTAVETNDVEKLAEVMRGVEAMSLNFDTVDKILKEKYAEYSAAAKKKADEGKWSRSDEARVNRELNRELMKWLDHAERVGDERLARDIWNWAMYDKARM